MELCHLVKETSRVTGFLEGAHSWFPRGKRLQKQSLGVSEFDLYFVFVRSGSRYTLKCSSVKVSLQLRIDYISQNAFRQPLQKEKMTQAEIETVFKRFPR